MMRDDCVHRLRTADSIRENMARKLRASHHSEQLLQLCADDPTSLVVKPSKQELQTTVATLVSSSLTPKATRRHGSVPVSPSSSRGYSSRLLKRSTPLCAMESH